MTSVKCLAEGQYLGICSVCEATTSCYSVAELLDASRRCRHFVFCQRRAHSQRIPSRPGCRGLETRPRSCFVRSVRGTTLRLRPKRGKARHCLRTYRIRLVATVRCFCRLPHRKRRGSARC